MVADLVPHTYIQPHKQVPAADLIEASLQS
jgi:hypothetical protein